MLKRLLLPAFLALCAPLCGPAAAAACSGEDLLATLPEAERAALDAAVDGSPYPAGNHWRARKDGSAITLIGTFHVFDDRMPARMRVLAPAIRDADAVYLEATEAEMRRLQSEIGRRPELLFLQQGPTLLEQLGEADWKLVADEMRARGIPPFMAAKFRPWYVTILLSMPTCVVERMTGAPGDAAETPREGLDRLVMQAAEEAGVPMLPLEEFDTVFRIFGQMPEEEQIDMVRAALPLAARADDMFTTMTEAYFAEEHRRVWEFSRLLALDLPGQDPEAMAEDFAQMEEALLNARNRAWMEVILPAAEGREIVVAAGAAHLSGPEGLLNLLAGDGWTLERLPF